MEKTFNRGEILVRNIHEYLIGFEKRKSNLIFISQGSTTVVDQDYEIGDRNTYRKPNIINIYNGNELGWGPNMVMSVADFVRYVNAQHILIKHDPEIQALLTPTDGLDKYEERRSIELANEIIHYATVILNIFENGEMDIPESVVNIQNNSNDVLDALHIIAGLESFDI